MSNQPNKQKCLNLDGSLVEFMLISEEDWCGIKADTLFTQVMCQFTCLSCL